ncbi:hypothetical protein [Arcobacter roscoffensis]|uniref:SD-repeat containing protein B domain-containing protein n=1 Tax=Arcobacter roscoffensis TaxID=2961520 RepID=A0ABY5E7H0_9BACT|nr:hypothetical protein [Arcobacter roscoffensis]UTJ07602.1 hypothetical protein NJU99_05775 [Arcobacter roscoffensis]
MLKVKHLVLSTSTIIFLSACGGGGGATTTTVSTPITKVSGTVTDGPIKNALVYIDENLNGQLDYIDNNTNSTLDFGVDSVTEYYTFTDENGRYTIQGILDNNKEYMVVVEGSSAYNTEDSEDNASDGTNLTFKMFNILKTTTASSTNKFTGGQYSVNHNANLFKSTLKTLDEKTFNAISDSNSYTGVKEFINDPSTDNTDLFQKYIKSTATTPINAQVTTLQGEVTQYLDKQNNEQQPTVTNNLLGLGSDSLLATSSSTSNSLLDSSLTQKSTIGTNYTFSKKVDSSTLYEETNSGSYSYITKYDNILQIPDFEILQNQGYSFVSGADIKTNNTTGDVLDILNNLLEEVSFTDQTAVVLYQYNGTSWNQVGTTFDIVSNEIDSTIKASMTLNPFIILENKTSNQTTKTLDVSEFSSYSNPLVVVKNTKGEIIDYVEVTGNSVNINYDDSENVGSIVVLSEDFKETTSSESLAVSLKVTKDQSGDLSLGELPITKRLVTGDSLLDIKSGNNIYEIYGAQNMIRTDIAYEVVSDYNSDTSSYSSYSATDLGDNIVSVVFSKSFENETTLSDSSEQSETSNYEGLVVFNQSTSKLLSAKYYQDITLKNSVSGINKLSGYITMKDTSSGTALEFEKGNYEFSINDSSVGTYTILTTSTCNPVVTDDDNIENDSAIIKGEIEVTNATTAKAAGNAQVDNTITTAVVTTTNKCQ